jgi:hypothetical protein
MLDGMADNNPTPYIGTFDRLKLEALTQIPLTFFGTCKQLKISGTWRQPSLTIDPPTDGTCPFNPPTNVAQLSSASLGVVTDSIAPTGWNIGRNLFVVHTHSACAESGRRYDNDPVNVGIGLDEDWELNIDLNDVNPSDTYLQLWFRLYIYNEPFNEFGLYVNHYRCAIGGLTEVRNIDFELTV